jgi:hypothetical protein
MTEDTEPDPQRKWLRLIDPLVTASLPIRIDPRLELDDDTASRLRCDAEPLLTMVTVFVTSSYDNVLAAEITDDVEHGLHVLVRAATGDEATYLLCSADEEDGGDPETAGRDITWQWVQDSEDLTEPAVVLWSGEVLLKTGSCVAGPFYIRQLAAAAWAFSTALAIPREEVFSAQFVRWLCAKSKAALLLKTGDSELRQLTRFWMAPIRTAAVFPTTLPTQKQDSLRALSSSTRHRAGEAAKSPRIIIAIDRLQDYPAYRLGSTPNSPAQIIPICRLASLR